MYIILTAMLCKKYNGKNLEIFLRRHKFEWQHYVRKKIDKNQKSKGSYILLNISMFKQQQSKQSKNNVGCFMHPACIYNISYLRLRVGDAIFASIFTSFCDFKYVTKRGKNRSKNSISYS